MSELSLRDHALRVAVLDVISDGTAAMYKAARKDAEAAFAPARAEGQSQQKALLPDGTEIGLVSIRDGGKDVSVSEDALEGWVREHLPGGMEDYADPADLTEDVLDVLRAVFPGLVKSRIRAATRAALLKEVTASDGWLVDKVTGDKEKVAEVTTRKPTGAFSWRPAAGAREAVTAAWRAGELRDLVPPALPAGAGETGG